jgi:Methylamine utilisation protein MauE
MISRSMGVLLGGVLLFSALQHFKNPFFFLGTVYSYELLNPTMGLWIASILPVAQFVLAAMLLTRFWETASAIMTSSMFAIFVSAQSLAMAKGLLIPCGCFGSQNESVIGWKSISWVCCLLLVSLYYSWWSHQQSKLQDIAPNSSKNDERGVATR